MSTNLDGASPRECVVRRWWRHAIRIGVDIAAIYAAWTMQFDATGSYAVAFFTAVAVVFYGLWCFYDGSAER